MGKIIIDQKDLRWDTFRYGGMLTKEMAKVEATVRLTHIPTGISIEVDDTLSSHLNREKALKILKEQLQEKEKNDCR